MSGWIPFTEQGVELRFEEGYDVVRWDAHEGYQNGLRKMHPTKAVDFVVRTPDAQVVLVEMKDFRGHAIDNKRRLRGGELAKEVAEKVRDTLAGIVWACGREHADDTLHRVVRAKHALGAAKMTVILWLDQDDRADVGAAAALADGIRQHLRPFLDARVIVTSLKLEKAPPVTRWSWLEARSLPGAHRK